MYDKDIANNGKLAASKLKPKDFYNAFQATIKQVEKDIEFIRSESFADEDLEYFAVSKNQFMRLYKAVEQLIVSAQLLAESVAATTPDTADDISKLLSGEYIHTSEIIELIQLAMYYKKMYMEAREDFLAIQKAFLESSDLDSQILKTVINVRK